MRALVIVFLLAMGCCAAPRPVAPNEPDVVIVDAGDACGLACLKLRMLNCPEGNNTKAGTTCEEMCAAVQGISSFRPGCTSQAKDRDEVRNCGVRCINR